MVFRRRTSAAAIPEDPEQLYRQLALINKGPEALWSHQADVLRSWHGDHLDDRDVAIELPTGTGKTLVGGLIGEYRRRATRERVAYLCLTRQLARQTANKLSEYGIPNVLLINQVASWNQADRTRYTSANAIAVSVYSHVFNINPALDDAQLLLLDDAHGAEGYVAGPWSLEISRDEESAYIDVLSTLSQDWTLT
jgi:superfamily II DNA or RNA helicase